MSLISTITGSLPNVLNLLQGKWDVQYKARIKTESNDWTSSVSSFMESAGSFVSLVNGYKGNIYDDSWESLPFDSVISISETDDTSIVNIPIENGSFRSVNKIRKPKQIKVSLATGGIGYGIEESLEKYRELLPKARYNASKKNSVREFVDNSLDTVKSALNKVLPDSKQKSLSKKSSTRNIPMEFRIITPFDMIENLNLVKMNYTFRKETGRNMLIVDLTFEEVINATNTINWDNTKVKTGGDSNTVNQGVNATKKE